jgi:ABC-type nickel/cobalt efflux system permease component RcnA
MQLNDKTAELVIFVAILIWGVGIWMLYRVAREVWKRWHHKRGGK